MQIELGHKYTRAQISDLLGGSEQAYLPTSNGKVVCGCFIPGPANNPNAPDEILFGTSGESPGINAAADIVFRQGQAGHDIPVFLKRGTNAWEYVGNYLCIGITRDTRVIARKMREWPDRGEFHGILRFEQV